LFANNTNKCIDVVYIDCMVDLNAMGKWSWGGMTLAYLYHHLDDSFHPRNNTMVGCVTLLMVINLILFVYFIFDFFKLFFLGSSKLFTI